MYEHEIGEYLCSTDASELFASARALRDSVFGREVFQRGVVEFSNICCKNCRYCGLRQSNTHLTRFQLQSDAILSAVKRAVDMGMGTIVLQSGEEHTQHITRIGNIISSIKQYADVAVTLSLGDHSAETYAYWRDCGADRYLLKVETFDEALHEKLRPHQTVRDRVRRVETLYRLGYETGSGIITGLPGMTPAILAHDLRRLHELPLDMIAVGPFVPHPDTPLGSFAAGTVDEALRATAILRIMNPQANIPATSALDALSPNGREQGLQAGANVVMPSVTPEPVRAGYSIYPGKNASKQTVEHTIDILQRRLQNAGYHSSSARGPSPTRKHHTHDFIELREKEHHHV